VKDPTRSGLTLPEYGVFLLLLVLIVAAAVTAVRSAFTRPFANVFGSPPASADIAAQTRDLLQRTVQFHDTSGQWPQTGGDRAWRELELNPDDWRGLRDGIAWGVGGETVTLGNDPGDRVQVYIKDQQGNRLHLPDGWRIWCQAINSRCYYHNPGAIEVDLNTVEVLAER
jgi:hypothetical protein